MQKFIDVPTGHREFGLKKKKNNNFQSYNYANVIIKNLQTLLSCKHYYKDLANVGVG